MTASFYKLLKNFSYIKAKPLTDEKAVLLEDIRAAVEEMKEIKSGVKSARNAEDFLNDI